MQNPLSLLSQEDIKNISRAAEKEALSVQGECSLGELMDDGIGGGASYTSMEDIPS